MSEAGPPQKFTVFTNIDVFKQIFEENGYTVNSYLEPFEVDPSALRRKHGFAFSRHPNAMDEQIMKSNFNDIYHGIEDDIAHSDWEVNYISLIKTDETDTDKSGAPCVITYITMEIYG